MLEHMKKVTVCFLVVSCLFSAAQQSPVVQDAAVALASSQAHLTAGAKLFIEPMDGFENYLAAALLKKHVPVSIVDTRAKADFIVSGTAHVDKAGWAKTIFISGAPQAGASVSIKDARNGDLAFAYSVDKFNAARANQSTAEACAKHLKGFMEKH